jgi:hypothetical protein
MANRLPEFLDLRRDISVNGPVAVRGVRGSPDDFDVLVAGARET